ncbi:MAG TPA: hypothetical protein VJ965_00750 [Anaerolineales bacterium]|nr:hypothetical protein [Anaerolineales bacterium]
MNRKIFTATDNGVSVLKRVDSGWEVENTWLKDKSFTSISISKNGSILAGARDGLFLSPDNGNNWQEVSSDLQHKHIRSLAFHPINQGFAYAGTEPAAVYFSKDGGMNWQESNDVSRLREENDWYLPYSPEAGCIRGFAFEGQKGFAAVEVGGMLVTYDFGETWRLTQDNNILRPNSGEIHADVHRVFFHPDSSNKVIAPTGGGLYISDDAGKSWKRFHSDYCRAIWVSPKNDNHMILGPADGPDRNGRIEQTIDGGATWETLNKGLDTPWPRTMVEHFTPTMDGLLAVLSSGRLIYAEFNEMHWQEVLSKESGIRAVAVLEE